LHWWQNIKAYLVLEDGTTFEGEGYGAPAEVTKEVVFNTGMVGYPESLTDPSYNGQILVQTYPLIGCYGVPSMSVRDAYGLPVHFESERAQVSGYVIYEMQRHPSHWTSSTDLDSWLREQGIPVISGIDTRELTKRLRTKGTMLGTLSVGREAPPAPPTGVIPDGSPRAGASHVKNVTIGAPTIYNASCKKTVVMIDCGTKYGILRGVVERSLKVVRLPYDSSLEQVLSYKPDGVVISNGPGDPKDCAPTIATTKGLMECRIPIMGICLGNQILALAAGADTFKLPYGHRGQNQPCVDTKTGRCYITSQNHGYAIKGESLEGTSFSISFKNANDGTVEGITHSNQPIFGVQFHPEARPGPGETGYLFDEFIRRFSQ